ncbi:hypothetical protein BD410DRAFT_795172 [Rickenella mellea]|uniref:F-box domain-containing protein n=1 Tax=Rickenella mellea TaxID=50990 RepID=A0A4Y7PN34_9AGAM|nr:hypothetical protein BD410DRAFT_795172 [Rickenella mellea]
MAETRQRVQVQATDGLQVSDGQSALDPTEKGSAAIHSLAPETLAEIFQHCLPIDPVRFCSRWRNLFISLPYLWSRFAIVYEDLSGMDSKKVLEATKLWISRSGSLPLSICFRYLRSSSDAPCLPAILALIIPHSLRWKDIDFNTSAEFSSQILAPLQTAHLPHLVNFNSTLHGWENPAQIRPLHFKLSSAPRVQKFHHHRAVRVRIDFGGQVHYIKSLKIIFPAAIGGPGMSLGDLLSCLTHCPFLQELTFPITEIWTNGPHELQSIIEHSHLHQFKLTLSENIDPGFLFDVLRLPALRDLELSMQARDASYEDWPHLRKMLAHSHPPLQSLLLYCVQMNEITLIECLSYIPSLKSLSLRGTECTDILLVSFLRRRYYLRLVVEKESWRSWHPRKSTIPCQI